MTKNFYLALHENVFYKYKYFHLNNSNPDNTSETYVGEGEKKQQKKISRFNFCISQK